MEQTFIMIKPDGVKRKLIGEILSRFERKGFTIVEAKMMKISKEQAKHHYREHQDKYFFNDLVNFITSDLVFAFVLEGTDVVEISRLMIGHKDPLKRMPGTIRGDYSADLSLNIIHGADSVETARKEIAFFFNEKTD